MCTFQAKISRYHLICISFIRGLQKSTPNLSKNLVSLGYNWERKSIFGYLLIFYQPCILRYRPILIFVKFGVDIMKLCKEFHVPQTSLCKMIDVLASIRAHETS